MTQNFRNNVNIKCIKNRQEFRYPQTVDYNTSCYATNKSGLTATIPLN